MKLPTRAQLRDDILQSVMASRKLCKADFFSRYRDAYLVSARREAAKQLHAAGFGPLAISRILRRSPTTVNHYIFNYAAKKRDRARVLAALRKVPRDVSDVVGEIAQAEGVSPVVLVSQWISERATYEAEAKARAA